MGYDAVQQEQKAYAGQKAYGRGQPGRHALLFRHVYGRDYQRPDGGRYHHAGGKAQQQPLQARFHSALQEEHKAGAQRGAEEWYQYADGGLERFVHGARLLFDRIISQKAQKGIQRNIYFFVNFFGVRRVIIYRETDRR